MKKQKQPIMATKIKSAVSIKFPSFCFDLVMYIISLSEDYGNTFVNYYIRFLIESFILKPIISK